MGLNVPFWSTVTGDRTLTAALIARITGSTAASPITNTAITTVGAGVLTAAGLVGGLITRTGPTAAYSDATATAAQIVTALGAFSSGQQFAVRIKNATGFMQTITGGTGVTVSSPTILPPSSIGTFFAAVGGTSASPTVTLTHLDTTGINSKAAFVSPVATALATVGAGTITAAGILGGITTRSGSTAAFTDTTDTAVALVAGSNALLSDANATEWVYVNNTVATATIAGGVGVTMSGQVIVPPNSWARYLVTRTSATAVAISCIGAGFFPKRGTAVANSTSAVTVADTAVTATSQIAFTPLTVAGTPAAQPYVATITPGTGFTFKAGSGDTSTYNYEIRG